MRRTRHRSGLGPSQAPRPDRIEPEWQDVLDLAVDEIAHYGDGSLQVPRRLITMLHDLVLVAPPERIHSITEKVVALERDQS